MALLKTNTGIGTTNPTSALHVIGDGLFTGVVTATSFSGNINSGVATVTNLTATNATLTNINSSGITTLGVTTVTRLTTQSTFTSGITTSVGGFVGNLTGTATTATKLETTRTFEITGDVVASPITFDGTGNVSLAATIQPNSVGLGTDTFGDYVKDISGTVGEIDVTGGTGEGSTPVISFSPNPTIGGNVTIGNDLQVNNNLNVTGNITVGGTTGYILVENFRVSDADIVLGFTTDISGNDVSNDTTANHGGIAIASTEGNPLITLTNPGVGETLPPTYKKIMWFKAGSFAGLNTDAWLSNYAIGIGSTQFPSGTRLAAGSVQFTENDLAVVRNINASGIITGTLDNTLTLGTSGTGLSGSATYDNSGASTFTVTSNATDANTASTIVARDGSGNFSAGTITANLTGVASTATKLETARDFSVSGDVATASAVSFNGTGNVDLAVTLSNSFDANTSGIITSTGGFVGDLTGNVTGNLTGTATTATNLADAANITTGTIDDARLPATITSDITGNAATATTATNLADAANITTGTIDDARLPDVITSNINITSGVSTVSQIVVGSAVTINSSGINAPTGIVTALQFVGTASTASFATTAFTLNGTAEGGLSVGTAVTATNIAGGDTGDIPYQSAANTTTFVDASSAGSGQVLLWNGSAPEWGNVSSASGAFGGITIKDEGSTVGTSGSVSTLNFVGSNIVATATAGANGISTVTLSDTPTFDELSVTGISSLTDLNVSGISTFSNNVLVGSGITMYASTGIISATAFYGSGLNLTDLINQRIEGLQIQEEGSDVGVGFSFATLNFVGDYVTATGVGTVANITFTTPPYADVAGIATYATTAGVATALQNSRDFSVSGDVATSSAVSFDGTGNVDLAVTLSNTFSANTSGIITSSGGFVGNLTGTATTATNLADAANITTGTIDSARLTGSYNIDISGNAATATYASNAGIATYATTAGIATNATTAGTATTATNIDISATSSGDTTAYVVLVGNNVTGGQQPFIDNGSLTYNASTNVLTAGGGFSGDGSALTSLNGSQITSGTIPGDRGVTSGSSSSSFIEYNGTTATSGQFDGGTTTPSGTTRLNYGGYLYATRFYGDGSNLTGVSAGTTPTENTTNQAQYIPFYVSTASTDVAGISTQSFVFNPSTKRMGIGTDSPQATLHVVDEFLVSTAGAASTQRISQKAYELENGTLSWEGSAGQLFSITNNLTSGSIFSVNDVSGIPSIDVDADGTIQLAPFGTTEYVGIGTTVPTAKLHVNGSALITGISTIANLIVTPVGTGATVGGIGVTYYGDGSQLTGTRIAISTNTTNQNQFLTYAVSTGSTTGLGVTTTGLVFNPSTTRLGIGTTNPQYDLDIGGSVNATTPKNAGVGTVRIAAQLGIGHTNLTRSTAKPTSTYGGVLTLGGDYSTGDNPIIIFDAYPDSSTFNNILIGDSTTGNALAGGNGNVFVGGGAGPSVTGSYNIAIGPQAVNSSISGNNNYGIGYRTLFATSGSGNVAFGREAGNGFGSGGASYNTFLGYGAGNNSTGAPATGDYDYNIIIGSGNGTTGFHAVKGADKQLAIGGNQGASNFYWIVGDENLNIGIGTTRPTSKLHVDGGLIVSGIATLGTVKISSGIVTATSGIVTYYGDGQYLSGVVSPASNGEFYTGVSSSLQLTPLSYETSIYTFPSTAGKQYVIESINVANVDTSVGVGTTVNIIASIQDSSGEQTYIAYNVPIVNGGLIELLKNPIVAGPSDVIKMWVTDGSYIGVNNAAEVYMNYSEYTSTEYVREYASTVSIATTDVTTVYTSTTYPSVIESIHLANRTDSGDYPVSVVITNGLTTTYLAKDLLIPRYATVDILDRPKRIETGATIGIKVEQTSTIDVIIAGKQITS